MVHDVNIDFIHIDDEIFQKPLRDNSFPNISHGINFGKKNVIF